MNAEYPAHGEPPIRSALKWPPCMCQHPECPDSHQNDDEPQHDRAADDLSESPTMRRVRAEMARQRRGRL